MANEIVDIIRAELGAHGDKIVNRIRASEERVAELDARVAGLKGAGAEGFKSEWFGRLAAGSPIVAPAGASIEHVLETGKMRATGKVVDTRGLRAARLIHAVAAAAVEGKRADLEGGLEVAREWGDAALAGALEETRDHVRGLTSRDTALRASSQRALGTATLGTGGALVAPEYASELLDFLHPLAVVRGMGASVIPMSSGTLSMPFLDTAATASYVGENSGVNESSPGDARLHLVRKILQAILAMSKELVRESSYSVDVFMRNHLARVMASREDLAFIRGDGTQQTPRGMAWWAAQATTGGEAHVFDRTLNSGNVTVATITTDVLKAKRLPEDANLSENSPGWIFTPRTVYGLMKRRNSSTEAEVFPELRAGTFYGDPYGKTTQIPRNLAGDAAGTGTGNKTELYYAHFGFLLIAESEALEVNAYDGGAYKDASGTLQSGITNREIVIEASAAHDFGAMYRGKEIVKIQSVDWGA
jgi:HK97 family phage major capsid protein